MELNRRARIGRSVLAFALLAGGVIAVAGTASAQQQDFKIAVVDLELVVAQSKSGRALQDKLEEFQRSVAAQAETLTTAARDLRARVAEGANTLTEEKLAELQKEYEDKTIEIRRLRDDKQREGQKMQTEGLREIEKQLEPIFRQIQEEGAYDLILNNVPGVVVMANDRVDITPMVVERLNAAGQ